MLPYLRTKCYVTLVSQAFVSWNSLAGLQYFQSCLGLYMRRFVFQCVSCFRIMYDWWVVDKAVLFCFGWPVMVFIRNMDVSSGDTNGI